MRYQKENIYIIFKIASENKEEVEEKIVNYKVITQLTAVFDEKGIEIPKLAEEDTANLTEEEKNIKKLTEDKTLGEKLKIKLPTKVVNIDNEEFEIGELKNIPGKWVKIKSKNNVKKWLEIDDEDHTEQMTYQNKKNVFFYLNIFLYSLKSILYIEKKHNSVQIHLFC